MGVRLDAETLEEAERSRAKELDQLKADAVEEIEWLKAEEQSKLETVESDRMEIGNKKAEDALLALERYTTEEKLKAEEARQVTDQFASSSPTENQTNNVRKEDQSEMEEAPFIEPNLDDLLDGSLNEFTFLDAASDAPETVL